MSYVGVDKSEREDGIFMCSATLTGVANVMQIGIDTYRFTG